MGRYLGLILFTLFVVWQVLTAILNQINANKQQQRAEELAKQRREAAGTTTAEGDGAGGKSRIDDLAARRKAQLEELRRRREAGRSAQPTTQARVGGPATGTAGSTGVAAPTASRDRAIRIEPVGRERKPDPWQARKQEAQRRERDAKREQAQRPQVRAAQQSQQQQLAARERMAQQQRAAMQAAAQAEKAAATEAASIPATSIAHAIRRRFSDPQQLREAFILKELLDPPVSIRSDQLG